MKRWRNMFKKLILGWMAGAMLVSSFFFVPQAAFAQGLPVIDSSLVTFQTKDEIEEAIQKPLGVALIQILLNLISFVANRLAYDAAIAIASGGKGQSANFEYRSTEEYAQDLWGDILGETIGQLSEGLDIVGVEFNVCAPTNPIKTLNLQQGIAAGASQPEPTCDFRDIQSNWEGFAASLQESGDPNRLFDEFAASYGQGQSELGSSITILTRTYSEALHQEEVKTDELLANDRFKDVEDFITGNVKTPSTVLEDQFKGKLDEAQGNQTEALQGALFGNEGALLQIGVSAGSVFLNTLLSQLTNKVYTGLFEPPTTGGVFNPDFINIRGRERARETFKGLLTTPIQTVDSYNVVNQFITCPGATSRGPNNCVMDGAFGQAVAQAEAGVPLTIQGAIDAGMLHGDWPLISHQDPARDQDPFCYTYGYCYSNLVKMRIARILPAGVELAAEKSGTGSLNEITLQGAVDAFNDCNFDNPDQLLDANHPYCHLVDPNWVIKYPETQCRAQVSGQTLVADSADVRTQTCVDTPSCIAEDENGNCIGGFGYCTRERNVWRFDGDICPAQYASCTTLTSRDGNRDSFLTNTVDFAGCNADNAGCRWYRTEQAFNDNATPADPSDDFFEWLDTDPSSATDVSSVRTYMNATAQTCDGGDAGCTGLVRSAVSPLNPVINASFENDANQDNVPDSWVLGPSAEYRTSGLDAAFGSDSVFLPHGQSVDAFHPVRLGPNQFVTVSFHARAVSTPTSEAEITLTFADEVGGLVLPTVSINSPANCSAASGLYINMDTEVEDTYERVSCTFSTPGVESWMDISINALSDDSFIDGVQIDEQEVTSTFHVGYGVSPERVNIRVAPDYLGCTGDATDPEACGSYAPVCAPTEVGCTAYTPTNGDPTVPGIINATNLCPTECVGYESYRQLETNFSDDVFPVDFIASSAESCTAAEAGCSEFTNLDALAEGGEAREYFTDVRVCQEVAESANTGAVYYTWEGSDAEGFQLRTWSLKTSNLDDAPCTNFDAASGSCVDATTVAPAGCTVHADIFLDPDCREFYDEDGDIHYRYYSDTVTIDDACSPYRKTVSTVTDCSNSGGVWNLSSGNCTYNIMPSESTQCRAAANGCRGYTGNTGNNTRIVIQEFFEAGSLSEWTDVTGVSAYSNESVAAGGHSMQVGGVVGSDATEGELFADQGYILSFWAKGTGTLSAGLAGTTGGAVTVANLVPLTTGWQEYTFGPVTPSASITTFDETTARLLFELTGGPAWVDNVTLREVQDTTYLIENSWVTPSTCDQTPAGVPAPQFYLGCQEYSTHRGDRVNLTSFASICREQAIGCEAFYDTQNSDSPYPEAYNLTCELGSTASGPTPCLFNGSEVCTVLDQQTSCTFTYDGLDEPQTLTPAVTEDSEIVPRDEKRYLVDLPQYRCSSGAAGCTLYGSPAFNVDNTLVTEFSTVALLNDPDTYDTVLCEQDDLFCEAYSTDDGALFYFKDPNSQTCEYKSAVTIEGTQYGGWFREGTNEPCYYQDDGDGIFEPATELGSSYLIGGTEFGIWRNGDVPDYTGWVGTCPAEQHSCSEFVDVIDNADGLHPNGRPYYFLNNEKIDQSEAAPADTCDGLISQEAGCVGFNNNATPFVTFNASASYIKSWHADELVNADEPFTAVDPVDCQNGGGEFTLPDGTTVDLCSSFCAYPEQTGFSGGAPTYDVVLQGSCYTSTDCGTRTDDFGNDQAGSCYKHYESSPDSYLCLGGGEHGELHQLAGACATSSAFNVQSLVFATYGANPSWPNDANEILKVRRDRQCSEWLACDSQLTAWDDDQGKYVNVCNSVSLCNEFSTLGNQSFCSNWVDEPIRVLDEDEYANRDVTWYGSEFSGYSIPNQYAVQDYNQVNVNPNDWCYNGADNKIYNADGAETAYNDETGSWDNGLPTACTLDADCIALHPQALCESADEDYRLAVVHGPCATGAVNGSSCSVGTCSDTGLACAEDADCGTDALVFCDLALSNVETGQCFNNLCATGVDTQNLIFAERQECRGYPEQNSPFPNEIVKDWNNESLDTLIGNHDLIEELPTAFRPGFTNANYCANGERCDCSYITTEYGNGVRETHLAIGNGAEALPGVCSGGELEGTECTNDTHCRNATGTGGGICQFITAQNTFVGWPGFCIQDDFSININASSSKNACLLWLPVDQLEGGTDIYNKYTEAGFSISNTAYCTDTRMFVDIGVTGAVDDEGSDGINDTIISACAASFDSAAGGPGAAPSGFSDPIGALLTALITGLTTGAMESPGNSQVGNNELACEEGEWDACWSTVVCPKNHFAIIGACKADANVCQDAAGPDARDDCPYFCVPYGSRYEAETSVSDIGDVCEPPVFVTDALTVPIFSGTTEVGLPDADASHSIGSWSGDDLDPANEGDAQAYGYLVDGDDYDVLMDRYASCMFRGYEWKDNDLANNTFLPAWPQESTFHTGLSHESWSFYLGCKELAYTSVEAGYGSGANTFGNAAYTNRVLTPNAEPAEQYTLNEVGFPATLGYTSSTAPDEVGQNVWSYEFEASSTTTLIDATQDDFAPTPVLSCDAGASLVTANEELVQDGTCTYPPGTNPATFARSYDEATYSLPTAFTGANSCDEDADCNDGIPPTGGTCLTGVANWACFIGCDEGAMEANDIAAPLVSSGGWVQTDGDSWCATMDLGLCIPDTLNIAHSLDYVCSRFYGHPSSSVTAAGLLQSDALGRAQWACDDALFNPTFFDLTTFFTTLPYTVDSSNIANATTAFKHAVMTTEHQCDGTAGDPMCDYTSDCGGNNGTSCVGGICSYTSVPTSEIVPELITTSTQVTAVDRLMQFFARVYSFYDFDDDSDVVDSRDVSDPDDPITSEDTGTYEADGANKLSGFVDTDIDDRPVGDSNGTIPNDGTATSPQVVSVTSNCVNDNCVEGVNGQFSVNGSEGRIWNAQSSFLANVEFYGYPDQNQFPLRKIIVDWGDGLDVSWASVPNPQATLWGRGSETGSTANDNYYKAQRGLNAQQEQICSPPATDVEWGLTPESCQEGPFQFQHHYRCTPGMFAWLNAAGRSCIRVPGTNTILNSPCTDGAQCVFQPRVYMQDNWEYCTGDCAGGTCYGTTGFLAQCDFEALPTTFSDPATFWNPWINWDGTVEVTPS